MTQFPPGYIPNYAHLAGWTSYAAAYTLTAVAALFTLILLKNMLFVSKCRHTRSVYAYLILWGILRTGGLSFRGRAIQGKDIQVDRPLVSKSVYFVDNNGEDYSFYKFAQIVASVGFMPLAEVLIFNVLESTTIVYNLKARTRKLIKISVAVMFAFFSICIIAYVFDFTINKDFGSHATDYPVDLALREIGFNGFLGVTIYSLFGSVRDALVVNKKGNVVAAFAGRIQNIMIIVAFQAFLMLIKLIYITYRNWNPDDFTDEKYWYILSIAPEFVYVAIFCFPRVLGIYDAIDAHETKGRVVSEVVVDAERGEVEAK
ncbi:hypothetical protein HDU82_000762 [Entophlyctis luteolus]|nr:hypothetical protein HDU82_000762 [Entophlyctis luteolus]KAJ3389410.1 hypothetical protein HDU84_008741 [Entophlyctis sp. JEL0112]